MYTALFWLVVGKEVLELMPRVVRWRFVGVYVVQSASEAESWMNDGREMCFPN